VTLWLFLAASAWFIADAIAGQPGPSLAAILITGTGVPFYLIRIRRLRRSPETGRKAGAGEAG
jgi:hypothetical protein